MGGNITGSAGAAGTTNSLVGSGAQIPGLQGGVNPAIQPISTQQVPGVNISDQSTFFDGNLLDGTVDRTPNMWQNADGSRTVVNSVNPDGVRLYDNSVTADSMAKTAADRATRGLPEYAPSFRQNVGTGVDRLGQPGGFTALKDNYITAMGGDKRALLGLAGVGASVADGYGAFDQPEFELQPEEDYDYGGPYEPTPRTARFQSTDDILAGGGREFRYFDDVNPYPNVRPIQAAEGGLMALDAADEGRLLEGPGDGVSDSIPAMVDDEQPVMLSDGEYIMPAEFVSAIGNGSSDAGAAKLTSLVDRVMANTRKAKKGKPNGADNMLKGLVAQA
jgi:hypothetical protein